MPNDKPQTTPVSIDTIDQMEFRELMKQFFEHEGYDIYRVGDPNDCKFKFVKDSFSYPQKPQNSFPNANFDFGGVDD